MTLNIETIKQKHPDAKIVKGMNGQNQLVDFLIFKVEKFTDRTHTYMIETSNVANEAAVDTLAEQCFTVGLDSKKVE